MSKYSIDSTTLSAIGNAIKTKKGNNSSILVSNFATEIANLPSGGGSSSFTTTLITDNSTSGGAYAYNSTLSGIIQGKTNINKIQSLVVFTYDFIMVYIKDKHYQYLKDDVHVSNNNSATGTFLTGDIIVQNHQNGATTLYPYAGTLGSYSQGFFFYDSSPTNPYEAGWIPQNDGVNVYGFTRNSNNPIQIWITMED